MKGVVRSCPLCGSTGGEVLEVVEYSRVWAALESEWTAEFTPDVVMRHTPAPQTELRQCATCRLHYFVPSIPGDGEFYAQLTAGAHYLEDRWEFGAVAALLRSGDAVVDFGCGDGAFIRRIAGRVTRAVGVDSNRAAVGKLVSDGVEAHAVPFSQFAEAERDAFDVVCAFQTLEHLADVGDLIGPAIRCLRPGGRLFLSVPNRERSWRGSFEPKDHPPHHVSRWHRGQFTRLAKRYGLDLRVVECEPPNLSQFRAIKRTPVRDRLSPLLGPRLGDLGSRLYGRALIGARRHAARVSSGKLPSEGCWGHTMLAEFELNGRVGGDDADR